MTEAREARDRPRTWGGATLRVAALLAGLAALTCARAEEEPSAVPYRPSVSTPAALSAPGWLEVEAGVLHEHVAAGERRDSVPVTLKLAFTADWGIRVSADSWAQSSETGGSRTSGFGDTG